MPGLERKEGQVYQGILITGATVAKRQGRKLLELKTEAAG